MIRGVSRPEELLENQVKFITFNYGRSLEQFLLNAISATFSLTNQGASVFLGKLDIRHVYGSLGEYDINYGFRYGAERSDDALAAEVLMAAGSIRTIPSARPERDVIATDWLEGAEIVFVMGFGFDPINCQRIGLPGACGRSGEIRTVFASAYHSTEGEKRRFLKEACDPNDYEKVKWTDGDCWDLLRDRRDMLG